MRLQIILILISIVSFGVITNHFLLIYGLHSLVLRNLFVMCASYALFFVLIKGWVSYLKQSPDSIEKVAYRKNLVEEEKWYNLTKLFGALMPVGNPFTDFGSFIVGFIIILILWALLAFAVVVGTWISTEASTIIIDAAFEVSLAMGLIKSSRKIAAGEWYPRVLKRTIIPFLIVLFVTTTITSIAVLICPGKNRLSEVVLQCWIGGHH